MQTHLVQGGLRPPFLRLFCRPFGPWAVVAAGGLALAGGGDSRGQAPVPADDIEAAVQRVLSANASMFGTSAPAGKRGGGLSW